MIFLVWEVRNFPVLDIFGQESDVKSSVSYHALYQAQRRLLQLQARGNGKQEDSGRTNSEEMDVMGDFQGRLY